MEQIQSCPLNQGLDLEEKDWVRYQAQKLWRLDEQFEQDCKADFAIKECPYKRQLDR